MKKRAGASSSLIDQEDLMSLNVYAFNNTALTYMKQKLIGVIYKNMNRTNKLQDKRPIFKKQLYFYILTMNNHKLKLNTYNGIKNT